MLYPTFFPGLSIFMAERTAITCSWRLSSYTLFPLCMLGELACGHCFFASRAALKVLVLSALAQQVVVESAYLDCLLALPAEHDHRTAREQMLVSIIIILEPLVELPAIIAVVLGISWLLLSVGSVQLHLRRFLYHHLFNDSSICLDPVFNHFDHLRFHILNLRVSILVADLLADLSH